MSLFSQVISLIKIGVGASMNLKLESTDKKVTELALVNWLDVICMFGRLRSNAQIDKIVCLL